MSNVVRVQFFGSGTITFPAGVVSARIKGVGGGGGGGGGSGSTATQSGGGGGGGGAAIVNIVEIFVFTNRQYNVTIGAAGTAGAAGAVGGNGGNAGAGGTTTVIDSVSGFVLAAFRGASGGAGGEVNGALLGSGGCDHASPIGGNIYDQQTALSLTPPGVSNPQPLSRSGGSGGIPGNAGLAGGFDSTNDGTIVGVTTPWAGGTQGTGAVGGGGGGGGGGGSALGPGGNGGVGSTGNGGTGGPAPGANTGAGGGRGGGSGTAGGPVAGTAGGAGTTGYIEVTYTLQ